MMVFLSFGSGIFLSIVLFILARQFRSRPLALTGVAALLLGLGGAVALTLFESEADRVKQVVQDLALAVGSNDIAKAQSFVSSSSPECHEDIGREMKKYEFDWCRVNSWDGVEFDPNNPNLAVATFTVWVHVRLIDAGVSYDGNATQEVRLWFRKEGEDNWKLYGYGHRRPSSGGWPDTPPNGMIGGYYP